jgi:predicted nucleic acid-binding protein
VVLLKGTRVRLRGTAKLCRDPHDDMFLECAEIAAADFLVTSDNDLLVLGAYKKTRIVDPATYLLVER